MRLDLVSLTFNALKNKKMDIFGGKQIRPLIHIDDITNLYMFILKKILREFIMHQMKIFQ